MYSKQTNQIKKINTNIELYTFAVESNPTNHNAYNLLGKSYIELGKLTPNNERSIL